MERPEFLNHWAFKRLHDNDASLFAPAAMSAADRKALREYVEALEAERDHYKAVGMQQASDNRSVDEALISLARKLNMPHPEVTAAVKVAAFAEARIEAQEATIAELTASREALATRLVQAGVEIGTLQMRVEALEREGGAG